MKAEIILIVLSIALFFIGAWPISISTLISAAIIAVIKKQQTRKQDKEKIAELEKRIEELEKGR